MRLEIAGCIRDAPVMRRKGGIRNEVCLMINGKKLNKDLTLTGFMELFPEFWREPSRAGNKACRFSACECLAGEQKFTVMVTFQDEKMKQVRLYPDIEEEPKTDQARRICDTWLSAHFGRPAKRAPEVTRYEYEWGNIASEYDFSTDPDCSIAIDFYK